MDCRIKERKKLPKGNMSVPDGFVVSFANAFQLLHRCLLFVRRLSVFASFHLFGSFSEIHRGKRSCFPGRHVLISFLYHVFSVLNMESRAWNSSFRACAVRGPSSSENAFVFFTSLNVLFVHISEFFFCGSTIFCCVLLFSIRPHCGFLRYFFNVLAFLFCSFFVLVTTTLHFSVPFSRFFHI